MKQEGKQEKKPADIICRIKITLLCIK